MFKSVSDVDFKRVTAAWNEGFSDYLVSIKMSDQQLMNRIEKQKLSWTLSSIYTKGNEIAGVILIGIETFQNVKQLWIGGMSVIPKFRGEGIANQMLSYAYNVAKRNDCAEIVLEVLSENTKALQLYQNNGFSIKNELIVAELPAMNPITSIDAELEWQRKETAESIDWQSFLTPWQSRLRDEESMNVEVYIHSKRVGHLTFTKNQNRVSILQLNSIEKDYFRNLSTILSQFQNDIGIDRVFLHNVIINTGSQAAFEKLELINEKRQFQMKKMVE
ncbi:putative acetyltransferase [Bacillus sp. TS-2]|nr:putative acetyltransferase [Bacillus sp. TS-2]